MMKDNNYDVAIIGAGPAGLMAAIAVPKDKNVVLIDKNNKVGKKLYITGKGRCNITNNSDIASHVNSVVKNPKFMLSSLNMFSPSDVMAFFSSNGLPLIVERGNRVFPASNKSSDVIKTLSKVLMSRDNIKLLLNTEIKNISKNAKFNLEYENGDIIADNLIVATGGISYSLTGSTGDGYTFAKKLGHTIIKPKPALVHIDLYEKDLSMLSGLTLKNVIFTVKSKNKIIFEEFGELLITHTGISGPIVLSASSRINDYNLSDLKLSLNLKPYMNNKELNDRLVKDFNSNPNKLLSTILESYLPKSIISFFLSKCALTNNLKCAQITKVQRGNIVNTFFNLNLSAQALGDIDKSIITSGGVSVKEINPKTMESKLIQQLFFAGEVIDVDALTGGYNLQIAFSTGYTAGANIY